MRVLYIVFVLSLRSASAFFDFFPFFFFESDVRKYLVKSQKLRTNPKTSFVNNVANHNNQINTLDLNVHKILKIFTKSTNHMIKRIIPTNP